MTSNRSARKKLEVLYGLRDMLTMLECKRPSFHHIIKKENGGIASIKNGALLDNETHNWLHSLEHTDIELYNLINECLILFKKCFDLGETELLEEYELEVVPEVKKVLTKR